jgi:hypothetical protein
MGAHHTGPLFFVISTMVAVVVTAVALAAEGGSTPEPWYKVIAGIIAMPAAVIGLAVSYRLFRKTNLESRKLELEIGEKERQLQNISGTPAVEALRGFAQPLALSQRLSILILRFVILELTLRIWNFVPSAFSYITTAGTYAAFALLGKDAASTLQPWTPSGAAIIFGPTVIRLLFDVVYWFIVFGFGWPILRDACAILGIRITGLFDLPRLARRGSLDDDP